MVKVGDRFDPVVLGHAEIDVKALYEKAGYVGEFHLKPLKIEDLPADVKALYDEEAAGIRDCSRLEATGEFVCPHCGEKNSSHWRKIPTGEEFVVCGVCNRVTGVR